MTIVDDGETKTTSLTRDRDDSPAGAGMAGDVRERLLDNAVGRHRGGGGNLIDGARRSNGPTQGALTKSSGREATARLDETETTDIGRSEPSHDPLGGAFDLGDERAKLCQPRLGSLANRFTVQRVKRPAELG